MDASVLKRKKTTISKGKIKKTIKNVICRPDAVFWPAVTEDEAKKLETIINKYRVDIPKFKKPHWKDIKKLSRSERPKQPSLKRVEGLVFGLSECRNLVDNQQLAALILEGGINPRAIVQPLLEACNNTSVPVLCLTGLKKISTNNFGIETSCLGIKLNFLTDLTSLIIEVTKKHKPPNIADISVKEHFICVEKNNDNNVQDIDTNNSSENNKTESAATSKVTTYPYLYRTDKKRVFVPASIEKVETTNINFMGQDYIKFSFNNENVSKNKAYKKMVVKRISNNPNRVKVK